MSFRKNLEKIDYKGDFTIEVIEQIIAAHNVELERIAAGINSIVSEPRSPYGANCYMDGLIAAQSHIRKEKCQ